MEKTITSEYRLVETADLSSNYKVGLLKQVQAYLMDLVEKRSQEEARIRDKKGIFNKTGKKLRNLSREVEPIVEESFVIFKKIIDVGGSDDCKDEILKQWLECETEIQWDKELDWKFSFRVLRNALENGHVEVLKLDIASRSSIDICYSARHFVEACYTGQLEVVDLLLKHKVDINKKDDFNEVLEWSNLKFRGMTGIFAATWKNHTEIVKKLIETGVDVNAKVELRESVCCCSSFESKIAKFTALDAAMRSEEGSEEIAKILKSAGAKTSWSICKCCSELVDDIRCLICCICCLLGRI